MIIFDLDGVLIDSMPVIRAAFETAYREMVDPNAEASLIDSLFTEYCKYLGHGFTHIMDHLGLPHSMKEPFVRFSRSSIDKIILYDGVREILEHLKEHEIIMTIATGKDGYRAREILSKLGIEHYFNMITGSDEAPQPKPAPDMLQMQMQAMGIIPKQTIMIGDSPADIQAGISAGTTTIGALWGYGDRNALSNANFLFVNIRDIMQLIGISQFH